MDRLTWIHADENMREIRELFFISGADMQVQITPGAGLIDNTWSMTLAEDVWALSPIHENHFIYAPGTEWGGPVKLVRHATDGKTVTIQGPTWRGLLHQRFIQPPTGQAYMVLEGVDANAAISQVLGNSFGNLFSVEQSPAGVKITASFRYQSVAAGLQAVFRDALLRLDVRMDQAAGSCVLSAKRVQDLSRVIEISQDYNINFISQSGSIEWANHCLALGSGELENRMVRNIYYFNGHYFMDRPEALPLDELRTVKLDYPSAETEDDLIKAAIQRLEERIPVKSIQVDEMKIDIPGEMGDKIGARDRLLNMSAKAEIVKKILNIAAGRTNIQMSLETVGAVAGGAVEIRTWGDLALITWEEAKTYTWGDFIQG